MSKRVCGLVLLFLCTQFGSVWGRESKLESWYTYWGGGWSGISYPQGLSNVIQQIKQSGLSNVSLNLDFLGFYWPIGGKTIIGVVVNAIDDRYEDSGDEFQISAYTFGVSFMHFPVKNIGHGPFVRVDAGPARMNVDSSFTPNINSDFGYGMLLGGGYAWPITTGSRLTINSNYSIRRVEGESYKALNISLGGLF